MDAKKAISILVVEDDDTSRELYAQLLQEEFQNVYTASCLAEAKIKYNQHIVDIIVLDLTLPDGNGLDFLRAIRKDDLRTKVIVLTAHSDIDTLLSATDLKLTKYLIKPLLFDDLKNALGTAIAELQNFKVIRSDMLKLPYGYTWDKENKLLLKELKIIPLSNKQKAFVSLLSKNPNTPVTKEQIMYSLWEDDDFERASSSLKTLVKNLRKKVHEDLIVNVYGVGYRIQTQ